MIFELAHTPYAAGYADSVLPLADAKAHLRVTGDSEDDLIEALTLASIEFVEKFCGLRLVETAGLVWRAESLPFRACDRVALGVYPVSSIESIAWADSAGDAVTGVVADFRIGAHGTLLPAVGETWPSDVGGAVEISFTAGFPDGEVPSGLISAVKLFLGHLYMNREAVVNTGASGEVPLGVRTLCGPYRMPRI